MLDFFEMISQEFPAKEFVLLMTQTLEKEKRTIEMPNARGG